MKRFLILALILPLAACVHRGSQQPQATIEISAYQAVVGAKAFIDAEKKMHPECPNSTTLCGDLEKATAAKDLLIDAAEAYCAGPQFEAGGACQPPAKGTDAYQQAAHKLTAALANYNQTAADLKGILK